MSEKDENGDNEVDVVPSMNYNALPKEVTAEIGSIKLFNKWSYEDVEIRDISLTYAGYDTPLVLLLMITFPQRLHSNTSTSLHITLCWKICGKAIPQSTVPNHRAPYKFSDDERSQQWQEAHGHSNRRSFFRDRTLSQRSAHVDLPGLVAPILQDGLTLYFGRPTS